MRGQKKTVEWAETSSGRRPAQEFFEELGDQDKAKVLALLKRFANHGRISNREKFKKIQDGLFEFKSFQVRLLGDHRPGHRFLLALGLTKKRNKHRPKDIRKALAILEDHDRREQA